MMKIHIYKIYFPTSDKCYIGQTAYLEKRLVAHLEAKSYVGSALWKYDEWHVSILCTCESRDEANRVEIEEIRNQNSIAPNGYNLSRGGEGDRYNGYCYTEEGRKKIGITNSKRIWTEEAKKRVGIANSKRIWADESKKKMGHKGDKNPSKNPITVLKQQRTKLENRLKKLEQELIEECPWDGT